MDGRLKSGKRAQNIPPTIFVKNYKGNPARTRRDPRVSVCASSGPGGGAGARAGAGSNITSVVAAVTREGRGGRKRHAERRIVPESFHAPEQELKKD